MHPKTCLTSLCISVLSVSALSGQQYQFRNYDREEGICNSFVYSINQDNNGYLMVGTGNGLCRFDGFQFGQVSVQDSAISGLVKSMYKTSAGTLWVGFNDGNTVAWDGKSFRTIHTRKFTSGNINQITATSEGDLYIATQNNGIIHYRDSLSCADPGMLIYSLGVLTDTRLLVGTQEGLYVLRYENDTSLVIDLKPEGIPEERITVIIPKKNNTGFWIATAGEVYSLDPGLGFLALPHISSLGLGNLNIQNVYEDDDRNLWISTMGRGVIKLIFNKKNKTYLEWVEYNVENGLPGQNITGVFQDHEGNIWIGTYGRGLAMLLDEAYTFYTFPEKDFGNDITALYADKDGYWYGSDRGLLTFPAPGREGIFTRIPGAGLPDDKITGIYKDPYGTLWIATATNGLYQKKVGDRAFNSVHLTENSLENSIRCLSGNDDWLWFATGYGVFSLQISTGKKEQYINRHGLAHNDINSVYVDQSANAWIATTSRKIYRISTRGEVNDVYEAVFLLRANVFTDLTMDPEGNIWAATNGNGVFFFSADTVLVYDRARGLLSDFCYSILADGQGDIWVGHRSGFSKIRPADSRIEKPGRGLGMTGDCNPNALIMDPAGMVLIGTTQGVVGYDLRKDIRPQLPPVPNIVSIQVGDNQIPLRDNISLPYGNYRIRIGFIGLSYFNPEGVTYQYQLDGFDPEWSEPSTIPYVNYNRISDGKYRFLLRTCSGSGICNDPPLVFTLTVKKPVWKMWWFYFLISAAVVGIFILIIKVREENQRKRRIFLEKELEKRTREVVEQKNELEVKNREITDSINYAQRIQASILPPEKKLKDHFPGSFIFFQPRDIVSGDFYWFDRLNGDRFLIVCADSTGHGVPGAFMSMIGSTLIKEFTLREDLSTPSLLLEKLDMEITNTLNQNVELQGASDGMDITICEINLTTKYMRFASAMRPIMLFHNNELMYLRGNRSSIGGELADIKEFQDQEYQLQQGDVIYMFSDGYPDQFGGPLGKKFKMVRLKNLLEDIHHKSMEEQYEQVKSSFLLWKKDHPQVDDVLFMGIKIP